MQKWEYRTTFQNRGRFTIQTDGEPLVTHDIETALNAVGAQGWELMQVVPQSDAIVYVFKRPAED